jgi:predicted metal-dependent hydrolase
MRSKDEFKASAREWADRLGVTVNTISIRSMTTKWASWSTNGNLTLNEELLSVDPEVADYVIVHELLHDRAPNHGKLWKSLMRAHLGDYEQLERRLDQVVAQRTIP